MTAHSSRPTVRLDPGRPRTTDILARIRAASDPGSHAHSDAMVHEYAPHERYQQIRSIHFVSGIQFGDVYAVTARIVYEYARSSDAIVAELRSGYRARPSFVPSGLDSISWLVHHPFEVGTVFETDARFKFLKTPVGWVLADLKR